MLQYFISFMAADRSREVLRVTDVPAALSLRGRGIRIPLGMWHTCPPGDAVTLSPLGEGETHIIQGGCGTHVPQGMRHTHPPWPGDTAHTSPQGAVILSPWETEGHISSLEDAAHMSIRGCDTHVPWRCGVHVPQQDICVCVLKWPHTVGLWTIHNVCIIILQ